MHSTESLQFIFVAVISVLAAGTLLAFYLYLTSGRKQTLRDLIRDAESQVVFLFEETALVDATPSAQNLLKNRAPGLTDWEAFLSTFGPHFPHLREQLSELASQGAKTLVSPQDQNIRIKAELWNGVARLTYVSDPSTQADLPDAISVAALEAEVGTLRAIASEAPQLIWRQGADGQINWANAAYLKIADALSEPKDTLIHSWPPAPIFGALELPDDEQTSTTRRAPIHFEGSEIPKWFEITSVSREGEAIHFAVEVSAIVRAENTQRGFVSTLGKTFADLSIGLAIFDRDRRLMVFNPALLDLTKLKIDFLSAKPLVTSFLDALRENQTLPEPKNYTSWREEFAALENAARDGTYCETWDLASGLTFRVTGRPHPDGSFALLFEDISAEVSLTRQFRAELDMSRAVMDAMDDAVAVFSTSGRLTMANAAYARLWGKNLESVIDSGIIEESRNWQRNCAPSPVWREIREFVGRLGERSSWKELIVMNDGRHYSCKAVALPSGATLTAFRRVKELAPVIGRRQARILRPSQTA